MSGLRHWEIGDMMIKGGVMYDDSVDCRGWRSPDRLVWFDSDGGTWYRYTAHKFNKEVRTVYPQIRSAEIKEVLSYVIDMAPRKPKEE